MLQLSLLQQGWDHELMPGSNSIMGKIAECSNWEIPQRNPHRKRKGVHVYYLSKSAETTGCMPGASIANMWYKNSSPFTNSINPFGATAWVHISGPWKLAKLDYQAETTTVLADKGGLPHILNTLSLGEVTTEETCQAEDAMTGSLLLTMDVSIPSSLKSVLTGNNAQ
ncbi:hypothetical protein O181_036609 [Austropuccinia psidii MF-1]|uniref:Uncharacterized protein n=1 Tax=Austropuccinia psidii MF-1 TaxID=1389203 RepID=A0A9Q3D4V7_9BASI|nr:hypothetical protein [Austropuccinia psidii MF-1]